MFQDVAGFRERLQGAPSTLHCVTFQYINTHGTSHCLSHKALHCARKSQLFSTSLASKECLGSPRSKVASLRTSVARAVHFGEFGSKVATFQHRSPKYSLEAPAQRSKLFSTSLVREVRSKKLATSQCKSSMLWQI